MTAHEARQLCRIHRGYGTCWFELPDGVVFGPDRNDVPGPWWRALDGYSAADTNGTQRWREYHCVAHCDDALDAAWDAMSPADREPLALVLLGRRLAQSL